jgi:hypothetical protein
VTGTIDRVGVRRLYTFDGNAGQTVALTSATATCTGLRWQLVDASFGLLGDAAPACADLGPRTLPVDGVYTIVVDAVDDSTGDFGFTLTAVPPDTNHISIGETVTGELAAGEQKTYTFDASAGDIVYLQRTAGACDFSWRLRDPDGAELAAGILCVDPGRQVLATAGTYTFALDAGAGTGPYGFSVTAST